MLDVTKITFHSHKNHNPYCDIVCYQIDNDTNFTYGTYVKQCKLPLGHEVGTEFGEVYFGENYNIDSKKNSYSRAYKAGEHTVHSLPKKYRQLWQELKTYYNEQIKTDQSVVHQRCK